MSWSWTFVAVLVSVVTGLLLLGSVAFHYYLERRFLPVVARVFQEKPLFISPRGQPIPSAEDITFPAIDGRKLHGCYLHHGSAQRRGVIFFGLEYGSNRWACLPYCEHLIEAGFDVFAFEPRGQGESDRLPGYEPLQWVTEFDVEDTRSALAYLKGRSDADARGVGLFGISKGGGAGLLAAATDPWVRCFVTDGIFATYSTLVQYMRKWIAIYSTRVWIQQMVPFAYYRLFAGIALRCIARHRGCRYPQLEKAIASLSGRPLFMIHGGGDTYVKPHMAEALYASASEPKQFWMVDGAKHNQALHLVGDEYKRRVADFFNQHLADNSSAPQPTSIPSELESVDQLIG